MYYSLTKDYFSKNKTKVFVFVVLVLLTHPVEGVILPQLYSKFFEKLNKGNLAGQFSDLKDSILKGNAAGLLGIISIIWMAIVMLFYAKNKFEAHLIPNILSHIRNILFDKFLEKNSNDYKETKQGDIIARILEVSHAIKQLFSIALNDFLPALLTVFVGIIAIFTISKEIGYIIIGFLVLYVFVDVVLFPSLLEKSIKKQSLFIKNTQEYTNSFSNLLNIYLNNQEKSTVTKNHKNEQIYTESASHLWDFSNDVRLIGATIIIIMFLTILAKLFHMRLKNKINVSQITSITLILLYFISNMRRIQDYIPYAISLLGTIEHSRDFIENILDEEKDIEGDNNNFEGIKISNLTFAYNNKIVLNNLNLDVKPKEKVALIGPSGGGKSTLMRILLKLHKIPDDAEITLGDTNIKDISKTSLRKHIAYINQKTTLFDTTILENMQFGNGSSDKDVIDILKKYNLMVLFDKVGGVYASAGVSGSNLSLGMQKIVIMVRGILRDSSIVLIDEPLAGLDTKTRAKALNLIREECDDKTVIIVTHDKEVYDIADRVIDMKSIQDSQ